ncbi:MAG: 3-deoxy-8-phosphooctulonate synthase [Candidatus Omnitrophica bacterium]|nr:3-deoxy-8-phosphooctulonate synthase [Candidatus Omnitrophota bacterium]
MREIRAGKIILGGKRPLVLIAGPCVIESQRLCLETARRLKEMAAAAGLPFVFKASFDKANRLSGDSFRGPGRTRGLAVLETVKRKAQVAVLSDVHSVGDVEEAAEVLDIIQIPALLCRQTDLALACGESGKAVNVKKGQFMAPRDMLPVLEKIESTGNKNVFVTERGVSFGYNNLVTDFRSLGIIRELGYPVVFDGTHSVQLPGAKGKSSSGQRQFVSGLSRAAVAFGCDGLFLEVHPRPDRAPCDGPNMLALKALPALLKEVTGIRRALSVKR